MIRYVILAAAGAGAASTFLPWEHYGSQVVDGWHANGAVGFVACCLAFVAAITRPQWYVRLAITVAGIVALCVAASAVGRVGAIHKELAMSFDATARREAALYRVGTGAWLVIASSVMLILSGLVWRLPRPGAAAELPRARVV